MIVEKIEKSAVCERLPLRSFLVLPFQRITRLKLLVQVCMKALCSSFSWRLVLFAILSPEHIHAVSVQNIVKRTTRGTAEATQAIKALKQLEKVQRHTFFFFFFKFTEYLQIIAKLQLLKISGISQDYLLWNQCFICRSSRLFNKVMTASLKWKASSLWFLSVLRWTLSARWVINDLPNVSSMLLNNQNYQISGVNFSPFK